MAVRASSGRRRLGCGLPQLRLNFLDRVCCGRPLKSRILLEDYLGIHGSPKKELGDNLALFLFYWSYF